jgi:hypothetical protein
MDISVRFLSPSLFVNQPHLALDYFTFFLFCCEFAELFKFEICTAGNQILCVQIPGI